ncbi:hypothetical protein JDS96_15925 [Bacillus cereus group sp. N21]|nr:hypothetical protein [Bacillus cereus group sp. N21]
MNIKIRQELEKDYNGADEVFMAMELTENALQNIQGIVQYSEAFSE